jgi:large subunit ribosomal protein L7/L12
MPSNIENIIESLSKLAVIELAELSKKLEEAWGVSANSFLAQGSANGPQVVNQEQEKTKFDVILVSCGENKINVIKEVRALTNLGLKEAKDLVEACPKLLKPEIDKSEAEEIKKKMESVGAKVELK